MVLARQGSTLEQSLAYYPLEVGDYWQYRVGGNHGSGMTYREVVGDTLMPNGMNYRVVSGWGNRFERADSTTGIIYSYSTLSDTEYEYLRLAPQWTEADSVSTFDGRYRCQGPYESEWFGMAVDSQRCSVQISLETEITLWLSSDLGVVYRDFHSGGSVTFHLVYASTSQTTLGMYVGVDPPPKPPKSRLLVYPNPASGQATVELSLDHSNNLYLAVFDLLGRKLDVLGEGLHASGRHRWIWRPPAGTPAGVYWARVEVGQEIFVKALVLSK